MPARRVATQKQTSTKRLDLPSDYEATPSLSSADGDQDGSSDFAPETPPRGKSNVKVEMYASDYEDEEEMKPDLDISDEDMPEGGEEEEGEDDWDTYGKKGRGKKRKTGGGGKATSPAKKKRPSSSNSGSPGKLGAPWDGNEDWALFTCLHPKVSKPDWKSVAQVVGRDAKSCQNRYATFGKRLESAIKGGSAK